MGQSSGIRVSLVEMGSVWGKLGSVLVQLG